MVGSAGTAGSRQCTASGCGVCIQCRAWWQLCGVGNVDGAGRGECSSCVGMKTARPPMTQAFVLEWEAWSFCSGCPRAQMPRSTEAQEEMLPSLEPLKSGRAAQDERRQYSVGQGQCEQPGWGRGGGRWGGTPAKTSPPAFSSFPPTFVAGDAPLPINHSPAGEQRFLSSVRAAPAAASVRPRARARSTAPEGARRGPAAMLRPASGRSQPC